MKPWQPQKRLTVIVIITVNGKNWTYDKVFKDYELKNESDKISILLQKVKIMRNELWEKLLTVTKFTFSSLQRKNVEVKMKSKH